MRAAIPLLHDGDSYFIYVMEKGDHHVQIVQITRFRDNQNVEGIIERFRDLDLETKRAVIQQINRRYKGKTVLT